MGPRSRRRHPPAYTRCYPTGRPPVRHPRPSATAAQQPNWLILVRNPRTNNDDWRLSWPPRFKESDAKRKRKRTSEKDHRPDRPTALAFP